MCKSCNAFSWNYRLHRQDADRYEALAADLITVQAAAAAAQKISDAFAAPDGIGDVKTLNNPLTEAGLIGVGPDDAPNTRGPGVPTLTVQPIGSTNSTVGTIETNGDQDYRQVTLEAGKTYEIGMYGLAGGPNFVPLPDAYIELYDVNGKFVTAADGGAKTPANDLNSGFDVLLTFVAETSGTYYINSRGFDNDPTEGSTGEGVGDYEIFVREADPNDPATYKPYYDPDSPLHAIDWGSRLINKIHQTTRNPDGNEGTRNTGNAPGDPAPYDGPNQSKTTGNPNGFPNAPATYDDPLVDSVTDADTNPIGDPTPLTFDVEGKNVITVYYAREGERYKFDDPSQPGLTEVVPAAGFRPFEIDAMRNALAAYSDVADIVYKEVEQAYVNADIANPQSSGRAYADLTILLYAGTPRTGLLGRHSPPDEGNEGQGEYNNLGPGWEPGKLVPGGFSFVTLVHELGHAHGLAHPHDTGGGSSILRGVEEEGVAFDYTTGEYDLNQAIHTIMSYEDGWPKSPYGNAPTNAGYGYQTGLSAFDIAVIQDKYGVNEETRAGNDVYVLPEENAPATLNPDGTVLTKATGYSTIWDGGGTDEIRYDGARNATIDLRPATLKYEIGGGGWMSYTVTNGPDPTVDPVYAGFTIANGAVIENATSGAGNDTLRGNSAANVLNSGAGADLILLQEGGDDTAIGGAGNDQFYYGAAYTGADASDGGADTDVVILQGNYDDVTMGAASLVNVEFLSLQSGTSTRYGEAGTASYDYDITFIDANVTAGQRFTVNASQLVAGESFAFDGSAEKDGQFLIYAGFGDDDLTGGEGNDMFHFEGSRWGTGDMVDGGAGGDALIIRGSSGLVDITFGENQVKNIESITVSDRFGLSSPGLPSYDLTLANGNVTPGGTLILNGSTLLNSTQKFDVDGSAVEDGRLLLYGGAGGDRLIGGAGNDLFYAAGGADVMTGGLGADTFQVRNTSDSGPSSRDSILDFTSGVDKLDLRFLDANNGVAGDQAFQFVGSSAFSGVAGQLRVYQDGQQWHVEGDVNGDSAADFVLDITLAGPSPIIASDFIL